MGISRLKWLETPMNTALSLFKKRSMNGCDLFLLLRGVQIMDIGSIGRAVIGY
jgi:hypothetical protein